ncbi:MAG: hypothetical protein RI897_4078 [Verrucomicrobiota bacterium]|jgi:hypothetical protein
MSEQGGGAGLERVQAIKRSLRCFVFGGLSLLPWVGIPFVVLGWWQSGAARKLERRVWNPARGYRLAGFGLSLLGCLVSLGSFALAALAYISSTY